MNVVAATVYGISHNSPLQGRHYPQNIVRLFGNETLVLMEV